MKYAVAQYGYVIHAIGETQQQAIDNFINDAGPFDVEETPEILLHPHNAYDGCLICLPCTDRLYQAVDDFGGDVHWDVNDMTVIDLVEED